MRNEEERDEHKTSDAAVEVFNEFIRKLRPLSDEERRRVLKALSVFYDVKP
jgi:hypothetical protein